MAVASAAVFVIMAGRELDAPGLYYDEVSQALASFPWLGREPAGHFRLAPIGGVPWLTMTYQGALKAPFFALAMGVNDAQFSVALWRWFGIAVVVAGWVWCCATVGTRWGFVGQLAFTALLLTDTTLLLTTRHDWGPTVVALSLRCAFLAVWLRTPALSARAAFGLGLIAGLAIFEKLSSVVLLAPLALALLGAPRQQVAFGLLGLCLGALPLAVINAHTWLDGGVLISLVAFTDTRPESWSQFAWDFLSLGQGDWVRRWILDLTCDRRLLWGEMILVLVLAALGCVQRDSRRLMVAYLAIGAGLLLLPRRTQAHHWIVGTPFHYAAIAVLVTAAGRVKVPARIALVLLLVLRLPVVSETASAIGANRTAPRFDPAQTRVAEFLAAQTQAIVVASTWGIANQVALFAQGRTDAVYEPIYNDRDVDAFIHALAHTERRVLYVAAVPSQAHLFPSRTARVLAAIERDGRWQETAVEADMKKLSYVLVRKFTRP
jgi:hypothetical protein